MSWRAIFLDGPLQGADNDLLMCGSWQADLYLLDGFGAPMVVGTTQTGPPPNGNVLHYTRNDERSSLIKDDDWKPGDDEGWAAYELAT